MKTILFVEDDPFLIDIYTKKLQDAGFNIIVVERGKKALRVLRQKKIELLLLDIVLPEVNGWIILQRIRQSPEFKGLKVVVLSNLGQKGEVEKGLRLGADKYLIKANYTPSEVVEEIKKTINPKS